MIKASYQDRIEFWKLQSAGITFIEVMKLCDFIQKHQIVSGHPLHASQMTALHILYGRPFKQRKPINLSSEMVPADYKDTHDALINMRDKIYAHTDVDGPKTVNNDCLNKVGVTISGGSARFMMTMLFPRDTQRIHDLAKLLSEKTWEDAGKVWHKYFDSKFVKNGIYEINTSKSDDAFLKHCSW